MNFSLYIPQQGYRHEKQILNTFLFTKNKIKCFEIIPGLYEIRNSSTATSRIASIKSNTVQMEVKHVQQYRCKVTMHKLSPVSVTMMSMKCNTSLKLDF
jgi:hypothetical protein